jgi:hypothetical protein
MNDGEASRVFVGDDAEILNNPSWVDVQIKQIKLQDKIAILCSIVYPDKSLRKESKMMQTKKQP